MNNLFIRFIFLFLILITITACQKNDAPKKEIVEDLPKAEIAMASKDGDNQIIINSEGGVPIPENWPNTNFLYSNGDVILSEIAGNSQKIVMKTIDSIGIVKSWLISAMQAQNMNNDTVTSIGNSWMATFSNDNYKIALLVIADDANETKINYTLVENN